MRPRRAGKASPQVSAGASESARDRPGGRKETGPSRRARAKTLGRIRDLYHAKERWPRQRRVNWRAGSLGGAFVFGAILTPPILVFHRRCHPCSIAPALVTARSVTRQLARYAGYTLLSLAGGNEIAGPLLGVARLRLRWILEREEGSAELVAEAGFELCVLEGKSRLDQAARPHPRTGEQEFLSHFSEDKTQRRCRNG